MNLIISSLFILLIVFVVSRLSYSKLIYKYNVRDDYKYSFRNAVVFDVSIVNDEFALPSISRPYDTVILEISGESNWLGYILEPVMKLRNADTVILTTFERGFKGKRYVNISALGNNSNSIIKITNKNIKKVDKKSRLYYYDNSEIKKSTLLVVAPHPDDAEIGCFGLYNKKSTYIVTLTAGDADPDNQQYRAYFDNKEEFYCSMGKMRSLESVVAPLIGEVEIGNSINLGYFDGTLHKMQGNKDESCKSRYSNVSNPTIYRKSSKIKLSEQKPIMAKWEYLVNDLEEIIGYVHPQLIVLPHPVMDSHPDHKYGSLATLEAALRNNSNKTVEFLFYVTHCKYSELYPFGSQENVVSLPPSFDLGVNFDKVYSYELTKEERLLKLYSMGMHHCLRSLPQVPSMIDLSKAIIRKLYHFIRGGDCSYYRRAIRGNELFFIYSRDSVKKMLEQEMGILTEVNNKRKE